MLDMKSDRLVTQLVYKVRLPVPLQARRVEAVEHSLQHGKRHGNEELENRRPEAAERLENLIGSFQWSVVAPHQAAHLLEVQRLGEWWSRGYGQKCEESVDLFWRVDDEFAIPLHDVSGLIEIPKHRASADHLHWMGLEEEGCHHPEVSAASSNCPEQVAVLIGTGDDGPTIGQDDVSCQKIVNGQSILARQVPHAAAQSQASHASRRDDSRRDREPEGVRCMVNIAPGAAATDAYSP